MSKEMVCKKIMEAIEDEEKGAAFYEDLALLIDTSPDIKETKIKDLGVFMVNEITTDEKRHGVRLSALSQFLNCRAVL